MAKRSNVLKKILTTSTLAISASNIQTAYATAIPGYGTDNGANVILPATGIVDSLGAPYVFTNSGTEVFGYNNAVNVSNNALITLGGIDTRNKNLSSNTITINATANLSSVTDSYMIPLAQNYNNALKSAAVAGQTLAQIITTANASAAGIAIADVGVTNGATVRGNIDTFITKNFTPTGAGGTLTDADLAQFQSVIDNAGQAVSLNRTGTITLSASTITLVGGDKTTTILNSSNTISPGTAVTVGVADYRSLGPVVIASGTLSARDNASIGFQLPTEATIDGTSADGTGNVYVFDGTYIFNAPIGDTNPVLQIINPINANVKTYAIFKQNVRATKLIRINQGGNMSFYGDVATASLLFSGTNDNPSVCNIYGNFIPMTSSGFTGRIGAFSGANDTLNILGNSKIDGTLHTLARISGKVIFHKGGELTGTTAGSYPIELLSVLSGTLNLSYNAGATYKAVTFNIEENAILDLTGNNLLLNGNITGGGTLRFSGSGGGVINSTIGAAETPLAALISMQASAGEGSIVIPGGSHYVKELILTHPDSAFKVVDNAKIYGWVVGNDSADEKGKIVFEGTGDNMVNQIGRSATARLASVAMNGVLTLNGANGTSHYSKLWTLSTQNSALVLNPNNILNTGSGGSITTLNPDYGTITFLNGGQLIGQLGDVDHAIALSKLVITDGTVTLSSDGGIKHGVNTIELVGQNSALIVDKADTLYANIRNTSGTPNVGVAQFNANGAQLANGLSIGTANAPLYKVTIGAGAVTFGIADHHYAQSFELQDTKSSLELKGYGLGGNIITTAPNQGTLHLSGASGTITGSVGEESKRLANLVVGVSNTSSGSWALKGTDPNNKYYFQNIQLAQGSVLTLHNNNTYLFGNATTLTGAMGTNDHPIISFLSSGSFTGSTDATTDIYINAGPVTISGATQSAISLRDAKSELILDANSSVRSVDANDITQGVITIVNDNTGVNGTIGSNVGIRQMNFGANVTFTVNSGNAAGVIRTTDGINFNGYDGTLVLKTGGTAQEQTVISSIISSGTTPAGIIRLDGSIGASNVTFSNPIGDVQTNKALHLLFVANQVASGTAELKLTQDTNIDTIEFEGVSNLALSGNHRIQTVKLVSNAVELRISDNVSLLASGNGIPVNVGSPVGASLKSVKFKDNYTLTIGDNVNVYSSGAITNSTADRGKIIFTGNSLLDASTVGISSAQRINSITLSGGVDTTVIIAGPIFTNSIDSDSGTLVLQGSIINSLAGISSAGGILRFVNNSAGTITTDGGKVQGFSAIEVAGEDLTFFNKVVIAQGQQLRFTTNSTVPRTVIFNDSGTDISVADIINETGLQHVVAINKDTIFSNDIKAPIAIKLGTTAARIANIKGNLSKVTFLNSLTGGQSKIKFTVAGSRIGSGGQAGSSLAQVIFEEDAAILDAIHADNIEVNPDITATFYGVVDGTLDITVNATASFGNNFDFTGTKVAYDRTSNLEFRGSAVLPDILGTTNDPYNRISCTGSSSDIISVGTEVVTKRLDFGQATLLVRGNTMINTDETIVSNIALGDNNIEFTDVQFMNDITISANVTRSDAPRISASTVDAEHIKSVEVVLDDSKVSVIDVRKGNIVVNLIQSSETLGLYNVEQMTVKSGTDFIKWRAGISEDNNTVTLLPIDNTASALTSGGGSSSGNIKTNLLAAAGDDNILQLLETLSPEMRQEFIEDLDPTATNNATAAIEAVGSVVDIVGSNISTRTNALTPLNASAASGDVRNLELGGVAGGDAEESKYGIWIGSIMGRAKQEADRGAAGYKSRLFGGTIGIDGMVSESLVLGGAFSFVTSKIKHRNFKSGDRALIRSAIFSIYGIQKLTDRWIIEAIANIGNNDIRSREKRITGNTSFETARAKYSCMYFGVETLLGYNVAFDSYEIMPMIGVKYHRLNNGGYRETGTSLQNLTVTRKSSNKFDMVIGGRLYAAGFRVMGLGIIPEIHGFINYDLIGKTLHSDVRISGSDISLIANEPKPARFSYVLGTSISIESGIMSYGFGYDFAASRKFFSHQGSIKFRVNF